MSCEDNHDKRLKIKIIIIMSIYEMMINRNNTSCHLIRANKKSYCTWTVFEMDTP